MHATPQTLWDMMTNGTRVSARCQRCHGWKEVEVDALLLKVGPDYTLFDRCSRCRFTPDCKGRVRFVQTNPFRKLWSELRELYWEELDKLEALCADPARRLAEANRRTEETMERRRQANEAFRAGLRKR